MKLPPLDRDRPIYQQIVDYYVARIQSGALPPGFRLPTVRAFSAENDISHGTTKHAYDLLEQQGYIEMVQGRGTFVRQMEPGGKKEKGMAAIDRFLDEMTGLGFSPEEIRIFLDLKLRGREDALPLVRLGAIDCCPEALSVMAQQVSELPHVEVREFLLHTVLEAPEAFGPGLDVLVTTPTHFEQVEEKLAPGQRLARLVMAISRGTLLELARIPEDYRVAVVCASARFSDIITRSYQRYGVLQNPPAVALFGQPGGLEVVLQQVDQVILPSNYLRFASPQEQALLQSIPFAAPPVLFSYKVEKGSLLYLEEQIEQLYRAKLPK